MGRLRGVLAPLLVPFPLSFQGERFKKESQREAKPLLRK